MANKLYKTLTDYVRCETAGEEQDALSKGYKDISHILNPHTGREKDMTPVPQFTQPDLTKTELHVESEDTSFQGETIKDLEHRFVNIYKNKKAMHKGKPTKLFKQYLAKHGKEWQQQTT